MRRLISSHKYYGESTFDMNQEVMIDNVEDDFDRLFIEHGLMSKCGSMTHTQYNTVGYNNRQSLLSTDNHNNNKPRTQC